MRDIKAVVENAVRAIKIEISPDEKVKLGAELIALEQWLEPLLAVDTGDTEPLLYSHQGLNVFREDEPATGDLEKLQQAASNFDDGFYLVPAIID